MARTTKAAKGTALCITAAALGAMVPGGARADAASLRWTAATPDAMVDLGLERARRGGPDALAGLILAASLDERAEYGRVTHGFEAIAASGSPLADEARWLAMRHTPTPAPTTTWAGMKAAANLDAPPDPTGLVKAYAILGPFQDSGGGLMRREGPEAAGQSWSDPTARFSWGVYDVAWRRTLPASSTARGVPLDLYVHPRSESCTYLGSRVTLPASPRAVVVHVGASGAVRLVWDGADVAAQEEVHPHLSLDRMAARIEAQPGDHLLAVKVCSAAVADEGRVRLRFTDEQGHPLAVPSSSDLAPLKMPASAGGKEPIAKPIAVPKSAKVRAPSKPTPPPTPGPAGSTKLPPPPKKPGVAPAEPKPPAGDDKGARAHTAKPSHAPAKLAARDEASRPAVARVAITPPTGVSAIKTPLEKALELPANPTADQLLAVAVLRTLGGADDARSPRAPGLLDHVVALSPSPDALALAGWISPFGANRSGWLNLALEHATAAHDDTTRAFAQRRLVATHLTAKWVDWAYSGLREEPLKSAKDHEALLMRALAKRHLGGAGLIRAASDDLLGIEAELKDKTPVAVLAELALETRTRPDVNLRIVKRLGEIRPDARGYGWVRAFHTIDAATEEVQAARVLAEQTSIGDVLQIGRDLLDARRYAWAREVFYVATRLGPNRSAGFAGLAEAREAIAEAERRAGKQPSEDPRLAIADLARARDLEPADNNLKAELALRTEPAEGEGPKGEQDKREAMSDEQFLVPASVILERARKNPLKKGEQVDRELHWQRVVTYHPDKRVSQLMHYAREIVIEPRTEDDLYEPNIPTEGDDSEIVFARLHRKDGTVAQPEEQNGGGRKPVIRWPTLHTGDVVEVAVRSWTDGPVGRRGDAPFYFVDYVGSTDTHPILYNEVIVDSPTASPLAIDVMNGKPDRVVDASRPGHTVTRYIWDNPPNVPDEPLAPKSTEILPVVVGSTFKSWAEFRDWYHAAVAGFTEPDDQVRRVAVELTKGKKTQDEKLKAIFDFVADDIRYVNYVSGEWWLPNRPQELLARRQGDCDDKAMLLITLLKAIGIQATEVLVQTRYTAEPTLLKSQRAAIPVFDHGIAYLPGKNGQPGMWLDATSPESRLGPVPSMDARTLALFVDEGPAKIIDTPSSAPGEHGLDAEWTIKLTKAGAGDLTAVEHHTGDSAFELRMNLKQADARAQWVEQYLANGWFPTVQVKGEPQFESDLPKGAAVLKYEAHSEGFARREGDELAVAIAGATTLTSQLAPLVKRTLPVVLPPGDAPAHHAHTITIVAPPGYTFAELPPGGEENGGEFGRAKLEFSRSGANAVVVKRSVTFDMSTIPLDKYAKWRAWLQRVDGLMHRMVRLVPAGGAK
ncbi:MAG TPA: transglutaminase-like domain-containing protein [Minicystis sp.]|nr:transglutaminase-like domain-containing protein [Minicystis sp.]